MGTFVPGRVRLTLRMVGCSRPLPPRVRASMWPPGGGGRMAFSRVSRRPASVAAALVATAVLAGATRSAAAQVHSGWTVVPSPAISGEVQLSSVTTIGPANAWAVGSQATGQSIRTLILHWNGTNWARVASPNPGTQRNWLVDVSAESSSDVWASGSYENSAPGHRPLLMHWNGHQWQTVRCPNVGYQSVLNSVVALSPSNAWAVGSTLNAFLSGRTLVEHWNGRNWTVVRSPSPVQSGLGSNLLGVTAASPTKVWAVGDVDTGAAVMGTLIERWNGVAWRAVTSPTNRSGALVDNVAARAHDAWAVGWRQVAGQTQPLALRWMGGGWVTTPTPSSSRRAGALAAVAITAQHTVWVVGNRGSRAYAARWGDGAWTVTPTANPGRIDNTFLDIATIRGTACLWAVGSYLDSGLPHALVERRCA
jgi:hypothetical protein